MTHPHWPRILIDAALLLVMLALAAMAVCLGGCASRSQAQVVADARETALALKQAPAEKVAPIAAALADDVLAATANVHDLPKPTHTAAEIIADPAIEAKPAAAAAANPPPYIAPKPPAVDPLAALLTTIGTWMVRLGLAAAGLAIGLFLASLWPFLAAWIAPWALLIEEVGIGGLASLLLGAGITWLGNHAWVIYVTAGAIGVVYAIRHRKHWLPVIKRVLACHHQPAKA